jgi:hypothetical protein
LRTFSIAPKEWRMAEDEETINVREYGTAAMTVGR